MNYSSKFININKENGYVDGYSNTTMQKSCAEPKIQISEEEAKNIAYDYLLKYNYEGAVQDGFELVYADNRISNDNSNNLELCYLITIKGKNADKSDVAFKIFINSETGEVYNTIKENAENKVLAN